MYPRLPPALRPRKMARSQQTNMNREESSGLSFETGLERLEKIVKELEQGDLALERALELFEEGMQLSTQCRRQLEEAENKIEILLKKGEGKVIAEPFSLPTEEEPPS